jgi:hypothetical protein
MRGLVNLVGLILLSRAGSNGCSGTDGKFPGAASIDLVENILVPKAENTTIAKTRGTGLLTVWTDIDAEFEAEFNRWYDEEHITRLLEVPGFLSAGRYVALKGGPRYLVIYELASQLPDGRETAGLPALRMRDCL